MVDLEWMWPGITTRYVLRERRPCTPHSADGRRYLTVARELELVENCVNLLRAKDNKGCAACKVQVGLTAGLNMWCAYRITCEGRVSQSATVG